MTTRSTARTARTHRSARARAATTAGALVLAVLLAACGGEEAGTATPSTSSESPSESGSATAGSPSAPAETGATSPAPQETEEAGAVVEVSIEGGEVSPKGERVPVAVGEPVTFRITSDVAGELHVHSTPESTIDFQPGASEHEITVRTPGLVEVELHEPATTVVQLEAR